MNEFLQVMMLPFLACLILVGSHAYLGFHVIERQVIFVDLALAQIAVLGTTVAMVLGQDINSTAAYWTSLGFTMLGAAIFSLTRLKNERVPQEAIIGIAYVVSAALLILLLSRSGEGDEHIKQALVGNILLVNKTQLLWITAVYAVIGAVHYIFRRQFFLISQSPQTAFAKGLNVRGWDFVFYLTFGVVVTNSVRIAGVLLVFSYLVIPSVAAMLFCRTLKDRLIVGWAFGLVASILGMAFSYYLDFPTSASVVGILGLLLILAAGYRWSWRQSP